MAETMTARTLTREEVARTLESPYSLTPEDLLAAYDRACDLGMETARAMLRAETLRRLRLEMEDWLERNTVSAAPEADKE
jgi:hypothetical protein